MVECGKQKRESFVVVKCAFGEMMEVVARKERGKRRKFSERRSGNTRNHSMSKNSGPLASTAALPPSRAVASASAPQSARLDPSPQSAWEGDGNEKS